MEPEFKIGDKVRLVKPSPRTRHNYPSLLVGEEGTVVHLGYGYDVLTGWGGRMALDLHVRADWAWMDELLYGVEWRHHIKNGENCQGLCKKGHGSYVESDEIEKI